MEYDYLYRSFVTQFPPVAATGAITPNYSLAGTNAVSIAGNTSLKELVCPSNNNNIYLDPMPLRQKAP